MEAFGTYTPHLFPHLEAVGAALRRAWELGRVVEPCLTTHNSGASVMLDANLRDEANKLAN